MNTLNKVHFSILSKAHCQNFHQRTAKFMQEAGFDQEPDTQEIFARYQHKIDELKGIVARSKRLEHTADLKKASAAVSSHYKYINATLKCLEYEPKDTPDEVLGRLNREIIEVFPISILRLPIQERINTLITLREHLQSDWQPLLKQLNLTDDFLKFSEQLDRMAESLLERTNEKADKEKGQSRRLIAELTELYAILALFVEAWSNTISSDVRIQDRQHRAQLLLNQCNEIIAEQKHSLAVAASNRRRAKSN